MKKDSSGSFFNFLPEGCRLCYKGAKLVLFITGLCGRNCFYCPVSNERRNRDMTFANERAVRRDEDVLEEANSMDALGTGITGGEPLLRPDRAAHYIKLLKNEFGRSHHIHLYTSLAPGKDVLELLKNAGLDEIRFHPPHNLIADICNSDYRISITEAHKLGISAGFEVPSIPSDFRKMIALLKEVDGFLNLNELEFSETNIDELRKRGYEPVGDISFGARGSIEVAESIEYEKFHFCSSRFKDAVQLRERFRRIARRSARKFDEISDDGTIIYGLIEGECRDFFKDEEIGENMFAEGTHSIETAWWLAEKYASDLKKK